MTPRSRRGDGYPPRAGQEAAERKRAEVVAAARERAAEPVRFVEAEAERVAAEVRGSEKRVVDPTAALGVAAVCGLLVFNAAGLSKVDLVGAIAGAAAMAAALPASSEEA